jgi:hypothetical protein
MAHQQIISQERIAVGHLMSAIDWLLSDRRSDETGIAEPSDAALDLLQGKIDEIEPYEPSEQFAPDIDDGGVEDMEIDSADGCEICAGSSVEECAANHPTI